MELHRVAQGNEVKNKPTTLKHVPYNPPVTRALSKSGAMDSSAADEAETSCSMRFERKPRRHTRSVEQQKTEAKAASEEAARVARAQQHQKKA